MKRSLVRKIRLLNALINELDENENKLEKEEIIEEIKVLIKTLKRFVPK